MRLVGVARPVRMNHAIRIGPDVFSCLATCLLRLKAAGIQPSLRERIEALIGLVDDPFAIARMLAFLLLILLRNGGQGKSCAKLRTTPQSLSALRDL